jgi:hypothetical protein
VYTVAYAPLQSLTVAPSAGTDSVNVDFSGGATPVPADGLSVEGGSGPDTLVVTGTTGNDTASVNASNVTFNGSPITYSTMASIVMDGDGGSDTLTQTAQPGNSATLVFNGNTSGGPLVTDTLNVNAGTFTFAAPAAGSGLSAISLASLSIGSGAAVAVSTASSYSDRWALTLGSLSLTGSAQLNLGGNDMIVHNGGISGITAALATGYNFGAWNGTGIASTSAAGDSTHLSALGSLLNNNGSGGVIYSSFDNQTVVPTDVLVKYTFYGDANLSGHVDGSDYTKIDNGFHNKLTGWANGDFNYDGVVDGSDYTLIDNAYNTQSGSPTSLIAPADLIASTPLSGTGANPAPVIAAARWPAPDAAAFTIPSNQSRADAILSEWN